MGNFWNSWENIIYTTSASTITIPSYGTITAYPAAAPVKPKKKTAIDWLNEQVEAMCAVAREALPA